MKYKLRATPEISETYVPNPVIVRGPWYTDSLVTTLYRSQGEGIVGTNHPFIDTPIMHDGGIVFG